MSQALTGLWKPLSKKKQVTIILLGLLLLTGLAALTITSVTGRTEKPVPNVVVSQTGRPNPEDRDRTRSVVAVRQIRLQSSMGALSRTLVSSPGRRGRVTGTSVLALGSPRCCR